MNADDNDTFARFSRRFGAIESQIPDRQLAPGQAGSRVGADFAVPSAAAGLVIVAVLVALVALPRVLSPDRAGTGATSTPELTAGATEDATAPPLIVTAGRASWVVACGDANVEHCEGAVELFSNNLGRSWATVLEQSNGRLTVEPRACPALEGLTVERCWDVTAVITDGPLCIVVATGADDPRAAEYFQIGGPALGSAVQPSPEPQGCGGEASSG